MIKDKLTEDLKQAQKSRDAMKVSTLRFVLSEIQNKEIDKRAGLSDDEVMKLLAASVKKRQEAIAQFETGGRADLVEKEKTELEVIKAYLPEPIPRRELEKIVDEAIAQLQGSGPQDFGKVMKEAVARAAGRASGSEISEIVKSKLK